MYMSSTRVKLMYTMSHVNVSVYAELMDMSSECILLCTQKGINIADRFCQSGLFKDLEEEDDFLVLSYRS